MDLTSTTIKIPEPETETFPQAQPIKSLSFTNGALKPHHHSTISAVVVSYKECLKNHAARLGGHALDGCGEFMPSPSATPTDPTSLKCAACGCHRNFHRRDPEQGTQPQPPYPLGRSPNSPSPPPPPLSSLHYSSAPHMLLSLSAGLSDNLATTMNTTTTTTTMKTTEAIMAASPNGRKRLRTKFSKEQKDKMYMFAERVGWKMQKRDEGLVEEFCNEVGVGKGVFKVWMHNNKYTFGKGDFNGGGSRFESNNHDIDDNNHTQQDDSSAHVATNGSSSSS